LDVAQREALFKRYVPLVYRLARISISKGTPAAVHEDLIQEGLMGLWRAVMRFEESKLPVEHISVYARFWIRRYLNRYLDRIYSQQRRESTDSHLWRLGQESVDSPVAEVDDLAVAVAKLPELERNLLLGWYGLDGVEPQSVAALAAKFSLTPSKVRTRIERSIRILVERMESDR
jgi:RNA polymerase sigma factor (sigma-70 family)